MAETNALSTFKFSGGPFLTFKAGDEFKIRVLTVDPVVSQNEFKNKTTGEVESVTTKFAFIVYNFTLKKAQILNAGAGITKEIQRLGNDEEWGANIKKMDIKISAEGEGLNRKYTVTPMPKPEVMTNEQIKECQAIDLDAKIENGFRMSVYDQADYNATHVGEEADTPISDLIEETGGDPINLDDIPF